MQIERLRVALGAERRAGRERASKNRAQRRDGKANAEVSHAGASRKRRSSRWDLYIEAAPGPNSRGRADRADGADDHQRAVGAEAAGDRQNNIGGADFPLPFAGEGGLRASEGRMRASIVGRRVMRATLPRRRRLDNFFFLPRQRRPRRRGVL
jgi:hypothetical protein